MGILLHDSLYLSLWWYVLVHFRIVFVVFSVLALVAVVLPFTILVTEGHDHRINWSMFLITFLAISDYMVSMFFLFFSFLLICFIFFFSALNLWYAMMNHEIESSHVRLQRCLECRWEAISFFLSKLFLFDFSSFLLMRYATMNYEMLSSHVRLQRYSRVSMISHFILLS